MFRNTAANAFAKNQTRLAYEDERDLYCIYSRSTVHTHSFLFIGYALNTIVFGLYPGLLCFNKSFMSNVYPELEIFILSNDKYRRPCARAMLNIAKAPTFLFP